MLRVIIQEYVFRYLLTPESFVEIFSIFPFFISYFLYGRNNSVVQFFIMMDMVRLLLLVRFTKLFKSEINRESAHIILGILSMCLIQSSFSQHIENVEGYKLSRDISFNSYFYNFWFMMTTISTVGYGSKLESEIGKISIVIFISIMIIIIPEQCSRLMDLVNSKSVYARRAYKAINQIEHIVLIGTVSQTSLLNFLDEYFHEDHGEYPRHCVLMMPSRPDPATELILIKPSYSTILFYIEGNSLDHVDLSRCLVERANAVIILSDKFSFDAEHEDTHTILEAMIIKDYI